MLWPLSEGSGLARGWLALATAKDGASKAPEALEAMECGFESTGWAMNESHWGMAMAPDG